MFEGLPSTWEEHGGDNLWLFQWVDNATLEGLTYGRLQVAGRKEGRKGWDCHLHPRRKIMLQRHAAQISVQWNSCFLYAMKPFWSYLIQERRSCQNSYMMKHDLSGRFWTEMLKIKSHRERDRERMRERKWVMGRVFWEKWSNLEWLHQITERSWGKQRQTKGHTAGCLAGCRWNLCRF